jgi:hypothetical protein
MNLLGITYKGMCYIYLGITYKGICYIYQGMPFGLNNAPQVFTKIDELRKNIQKESNSSQNFL